MGKLSNATGSFALFEYLTWTEYLLLRPITLVGQLSIFLPLI